MDFKQCVNVKFFLSCEKVLKNEETEDYLRNRRKLAKTGKTESFKQVIDYTRAYQRNEYLVRVKHFN